MSFTELNIFANKIAGSCLMTDTTGSPSRVRIGFVGAGNATRNIHLRALQNVADLEVVAIADPDPEA